MESADTRPGAEAPLIYLDYNASTPVAPAVFEAMEPFLTRYHGNPSAGHAMGRILSDALAEARACVADLLATAPDRVVFTSGGTESNNTVIKGVAHTFKDRGRHIITSTIEHPAVLNPCAFLERNGYTITRVGVDPTGWVDPRSVRDALRPDTILVTIMHANNEVGTIQPIRAIADLAHAAGVLVHTDAAQAVGKIPTRVDELGVDFLSLAGHKLYAPHGVGALYIRDGIEIEPLLHGAGHERGCRAGTEAVPAIVGLGAAARMARDHLDDDGVRALRDRLHAGLREAFSGELRLNGHPQRRLPNTLNVSFIGVRNADLLAGVPGICATAAAACHSGLTTGSPVLRAMGLPAEVINSALRLSLGHTTSAHDIERAIEILTTAANRLLKT